MWIPVTKILIKQNETICISPLACLCSGFPLGITALLATVVVVKVGDKSQTILYKFSKIFVIHLSRLTFSITPDEALVETRQKLVIRENFGSILRKLRPFGLYRNLHDFLYYKFSTYKIIHVFDIFNSCNVASSY